jgi:hypothetical protein
MKRRLASLVALAVVFVFMNGCGTFKAYEGPELPDSELATIHGYYRFWLISQASVVIRSVDGKSACDSEAKVLPGLHWIKFAEGLLSLIGRRDLMCGIEIQTKAGHEYYIVPHSLEFETWPVRSGLHAILKRGFVQIEDRMPGISLGKMRIPAECTTGDVCRTDADCIVKTETCLKQSGFTFGVCYWP